MSIYSVLGTSGCLWMFPQQTLKWPFDIIVSILPIRKETQGTFSTCLRTLSWGWWGWEWKSGSVPPEPMLVTSKSHVIVVIQSLNPVWLCNLMDSWTIAHQAPLSSTISQTMLKFLSTESVMLSKHVILCYSLLLLPSIFHSISGFSSKSAPCIRWPKIIELRY